MSAESSLSPLLVNSDESANPKPSNTAKYIKTGLAIAALSGISLVSWLALSGHGGNDHLSLQSAAQAADDEAARVAAWADMRKAEKDDWDWDINEWAEIDWDSVVDRDYKNDLYVLVKTSEFVDAKKANRICYDRYRTLLASIHNDGEQALAAKLIHYSGVDKNMPVYIGLNDAKSHGKEHEGEWRYKDMTVVDYFKWAHGYPNQNGDNDEDCVTLKGSNWYRWNDIACDTPVNYFLCNKPSDRYKAIPKLQNWRSQQDECYNRYNAPLAIIHSMAENLAVARVCGVWCMCIPDFDCDGCAIGLSDRYDEGTWDTWVNGDAVDFENWLEGEPSNSGKGRASQDFGILNVMVRNNKWYDISAKQDNIMGVCDLGKRVPHCCRGRDGMDDEVDDKCRAKDTEYDCLKYSQYCVWERCKCCRYDDRAEGSNKKMRLECPQMKGNDMCDDEEFCRTDALMCFPE